MTHELYALFTITMLVNESQSHEKQNIKSTNELNHHAQFICIKIHTENDMIKKLYRRDFNKNKSCRKMKEKNIKERE